VETLVLSSGWEPLARVSWQRAVCLLWQGKVEVVEEYEGARVRSVTLELRLPSVIRLLRHGRVGRRQVRLSRDNVWVRDRGRCQYCARALSRREATFDHVVPRAQGGRTCWDNIVIACVPCNQRKGGRTPTQAGMALRTVPVRPRWLATPVQLSLQLESGVPPSWRRFVRDVAYWYGALEEG
jgi:5-methylcytosine-specific restriction endonuclease McrA